MKEKLEITITKNDNKYRIELAGIIDEDANFDTITQTNPTAIEFDFEKVEMINSCGIREWTNFIRTLPEQTKIEYFNCPSDIIEQINMIVDFLGQGAIVKTFYAPYFCNTCDKEQIVLLANDEITNTSAPEKKCSQCSEVLEFDALEEQYFDFLDKKE